MLSQMQLCQLFKIKMSWQTHVNPHCATVLERVGIGPGREAKANLDTEKDKLQL